MFFALLSHAHLFAIVCLACMAIGAAQVQRGWRSIDQVRGHLADIHEQPGAAVDRTLSRRDCAAGG